MSSCSILLTAKRNRSHGNNRHLSIKLLRVGVKLNAVLMTSNSKASPTRVITIPKKEKAKLKLQSKSSVHSFGTKIPRGGEAQDSDLINNNKLQQYSARYFRKSQIEKINNNLTSNFYALEVTLSKMRA